MSRKTDAYREQFAEERALFVAFVTRRVAAGANPATCFHAWADVIGFMVPQLPSPFTHAESLELIADAVKEGAARCRRENFQ